MGSRRKKTTERSSAGAAGVSRQARRDPITGQYDKPSPEPPSPEPAHEPPGRSDTGKHARPDTGKHARLGLVTRQTEDGSFEMVYGALDEDDAPSQDSAPATVPIWRQRLGLVVAGGLAALLLVIGGAAVALWWFNQDDAPRKVVAKQDEQPAAPAANPDQKPYRYVPPSEIKGRVNLNEEEGEGAQAEAPQEKAPQGGELNANPAGIAAPLSNPAFGVKPSLRGIPTGPIAPHLPQINPELQAQPILKTNPTENLEEPEGEEPEGEEPEGEGEGEGATEEPAEGEDGAAPAAGEPEEGLPAEGEAPAEGEEPAVE